MKFKSLNETYWIDNKEVMDQVSTLGKELEADGFKFYSDRYSGSTYYDFYTKRGDNGAICKAVQYSYEGAQIIDITIDQLIGKEPIDGFETMRRKLGKMLLPQNEAVEEDKEDKFVLYFPYLEPKIISKDRAIKQMEFELNEFKNNSGASVAGRGFGIYCLQSYDPDTDSVWTGRYSSKEFLKVLDESMLKEAFDTAVDFPYMFFYSCNNPTFGYDFQLFARSLGARKVYGRYKGTGAGTYFYLVPSEEVYEKLKAVARDKYTVEMQRLLPYDAEKYPKVQYIKESLNEDSDEDIVWPIGPNTLTLSGASRRLTALRGDIKLLMNCDTAEDVKVHAEEFQMYNCANIVERKMAKGMSEADAIDSTETYLMNCLSQWKSDMVKFRDEAAVAMQTFNTVKNALSQYELISADEERCVLKYRPIEGAAHKDCIEFVDAVVAAVNGKYNFTGRGGSWTRWDIRTADGVMLKAGWDDDGDTWSVTFPRLKFEALVESFEMAAGGDDFDGEIAAMRQEQSDLERRRAARKERFALMHKLFDDKMNADPDARWIDKVYHIFDTAESVTFVGDKYGRIPGRTEDKQPIRYRYSIEEYDFYSDPYWEIIYVGTNNVDPLKEDLEDDFDLYMKASDFKCKLSRYDVEEAANPDELIIYMEDVYSILSDEYGAENIKWWKFYEDDDVDFGYKVCLKDGSKHIVEINNDRVDEINEAVNPADLTDCPECGGPVFDSRRGVCTKCSYRESLTEDAKPQYVICGVTNEGTRMLYDAVNDNFTTDYDSATKYDDMDVARDDWFKIPRSGFRRIFIPIYDPAVFESVKEAFDADKVQKRIACTTEFDNGHVFHNDYFRASSAEAEKRAKQASIENPDKVFYVKYDDVMNPSSDIKWKNGEQLQEKIEDDCSVTIQKEQNITDGEKVSEISWVKSKDGKDISSFVGVRKDTLESLSEDINEPIYFDPDDEFEVDFRYYVYANNDDVVSDAFDFEEDAIAWAQENNYPIVKIHNYYRDVDGQLNPDGDPEIVWEA